MASTRQFYKVFASIAVAVVDDKYKCFIGKDHFSVRII
jgi:hypothetical protein